eukprot:CAMPEP_0179123242 /NCGR_PEP_ID=MMETSP0796-20121207/58198_1 /TAXON_ID=73915 /ORGANISM="Pyrodinium bahamense, Strain pbaha01" /LENGTH=34 /DNA_ID= /DNA_START= /DNA_END= /DNA_ORIENTATION=
MGVLLLSKLRKEWVRVAGAQVLAAGEHAAALLAA